MINTSHCQIAVTQSRPDGQPVLFIHGNSSCKEVFRHQIGSSGFGDRYRCIAMDLPGHGASADAADPVKTYGIPGYADCALEVFASLKAENAIINGAGEAFVNNDFVESVNYANLWENKVHLLDKIGHAPFLEAPDQYNPILKRFLEDVVPATG